LSEQIKVISWNEDTDWEHGYYWISCNLNSVPSNEWGKSFTNIEDRESKNKNIRVALLSREGKISIGINSDEDVNEGLKKFINKLVKNTNELTDLEKQKTKKAQDQKLLEEKKKEEMIKKIKKKLKDIKRLKND
jgi:DnaJ-domain-containing protein 1